MEVEDLTVINGADNGDPDTPLDPMEQLQKQRESLKQNIQEMDQNIKKLSGRGHVPIPRRNTSGGVENRIAPGRRVPLKRDNLSSPSVTDPPNKRRWGNTAFNAKRNLPPSTALPTRTEESVEDRRPTVQSSVVVTAPKVADEPPPEPPKEDATMKKRNKRMFGLLLGTLKQFKQDSAMKTETESKQEEKLIQVEEKVQREKEEIIERKKDLIQTRQGKRLELQELEFKIAMTELNQDLKTHYDNFTGFIQLKSTPCIFYKPAIHNKKTEKLLEESVESFRESFEQRQKEISMCTEEDIQLARVPWENERKTPGNNNAGSRRLFRYNNGKTTEARSRNHRKTSNAAEGKSVSDPIIIDRVKNSSANDPIVVDKDPITVDDDDRDNNDDDDNDVTIIDDSNADKEGQNKEDNDSSRSRRKFRSVVVGGEHRNDEGDGDGTRSDGGDDSMITEPEELSYTEFGEDVTIDDATDHKNEGEDNNEHNSPKDEEHATTPNGEQESFTSLCEKDDANDDNEVTKPTKHTQRITKTRLGSREGHENISDRYSVHKQKDSEHHEADENTDQLDQPPQQDELPLEDIPMPDVEDIPMPDVEDIPMPDVSIYDEEKSLCEKNTQETSQHEEDLNASQQHDEDHERNIFTGLLSAVNNNSADEFDFSEKQRGASYSVLDERSTV